MSLYFYSTSNYVLINHLCQQERTTDMEAMLVLSLTWYQGVHRLADFIKVLCEGLSLKVVW
jgi:hypothetical protein